MGRIAGTLGQWASDVKKNTDLDLGGRVRGILLDTKHYMLREYTIRKYLEEHDVKKLQIGTGENELEGWLNTDLFPESRVTAFMDVTRPFPFANDTFDYVFSEHMIEHVTFDEGRYMLREVFRVMKPGASLRLVTPDMAALIKLFEQEKDEVQEKYIRWITDRFMPDLNKYREIFVVNNCVRFSGHQFIYDKPTLAESLRETGFVDVRECETGKSEIEVFNGLDSHGDYIDSEEINKYESMVFEARRPG